MQVELESIRINYAELLFRWGRNLDRIEVVKLFRLATVRHPNAFALSIMQPGNDSHGLGAFFIELRLCRKLILANSDGEELSDVLFRAAAAVVHDVSYLREDSSKCEMLPLSASGESSVVRFLQLCYQQLIPCVLSELIQTCSICFHAGHSACLEKWFDQFDFCPSGCGHS